jgi:hypothetical protein
MATYADRRDPGGLTLSPGISGGGEGSPENAGGHSSSTPGGPPTFRRFT